MSLSDDSLATYLIQKGHFLTALEFHQELLEGNNGVHSVAALNRFFGDAQNFEKLVAKVTESEDAANNVQQRPTSSSSGEFSARSMQPITRPYSNVLFNHIAALINFSINTSSFQSPFAKDGLQGTLAARDQRIALLEYKLRCVEQDYSNLKLNLEDSGATPLASTTAISQSVSVAGSSTTSSSNLNLSKLTKALTPLSLPTAEDEDGQPITDRERRTINALVRRYLLDRNYKSSAVAFSEEAGSSNADINLLSMPGHKRGRGSNLSLLGMHRTRIAPIQDLKASEERSDGEIERLRRELSSALEQLHLAHEALHAAQASTAQLQQELLLAKTIVGSSGQASSSYVQAPTGQPLLPMQVIQQPSLLTSTATGAGSKPSTNVSNLSPISTVHGPALLRALTEGLPILCRATVTKLRGALVPLVAAAAAADGGIESKRALISAMMTLIKRPSFAERHLIKAQTGVLAAKLGSQASEQDVMPEVILLAKMGKTKERRALAAMLCGTLATHVSDKRCDALLAVLADLAESRHSIVRVGVIDGLTAVAQTLSDRLKKALDSQGGASGTQLESFSLRQLSQVEEIMWRCLFSSAGQTSADSNGAETEAAELGLAANSEHAPAIPTGFALIGTPEGDALANPKGSAAQLTQALLSGKNASGGSGSSAAEAAYNRPLPSSWSIVPTSVLSCVGTQLIPVLVLWSYRLNVLWTGFLPQILAMLGDTLSSKAATDELPSAARSLLVPSAASTTQSGAAASGAGRRGSHAESKQTDVPGQLIASLRPTPWHSRRIEIILGVLASTSIRLRQCVFDEGYSITFRGPVSAPAPAPSDTAVVSGDGSIAAPPPPPTAMTTPSATTSSGSSSDYIYELFDFCNGDNVQRYPPTIPLIATLVRNQAVYDPSISNPSEHTSKLLPSQQRQALILGALLRGTIAVRRRRNASIDPATLQPGQSPWQAVRDEHVTLSWPSLKWVVRGLVPTLVRHAACVNRASSAGKQIIDAYADALCQIGTAFGPAFTSFVLRPVFLRAFSIPSELPPSPTAMPPAVLVSSAISANATPAATASIVALATPGLKSRNSACILFAQAILGVPATPDEAKRAFAAASSGHFGGVGDSSYPINYASAGPTGCDWPLALPELAFLHRESSENPLAWAPASQANRSAAQAHQAAVAAAQAQGPQAQLAVAVAAAGGSWNYENLLPLFGSAILSCPALQPREFLEHALRSLVMLVAIGKGGWNQASVALEDTVLRAAGKDASSAASAADVSHHNTNLQFIMSEVLGKLRDSPEPLIRSRVALLFKAMIPRLSHTQLEDPFLSSIRKLSADKDPTVVRAAASALAAVYTSGSAAGTDDKVRSLINAEVRVLLEAGPKDVIIEILRALMRAIPNASPGLRDGFILDRLLEINERLVSASEAGAEAMREIASNLYGDFNPKDLHDAAAAGLDKARKAAIEANAPWPGAQPDDLGEAAMAISEALLAFGSCLLPQDVRGMVRDAAGKLLRSDLLEPGYRDAKKGAFAKLFPLPISHGGHDASDGGAGDEFSGFDESGARLSQHSGEEKGEVLDSDAFSHLSSTDHNHSSGGGSGSSGGGSMTSIASSYMKGTMKSLSGWGSVLGSVAGEQLHHSQQQQQQQSHQQAPVHHAPPPQHGRRLSSAGSEAPTMSLASFSGSGESHGIVESHGGGGGGGRRTSIPEAPSLSMSSFMAPPSATNPAFSSPPPPPSAPSTAKKSLIGGLSKAMMSMTN